MDSLLLELDKVKTGGDRRKEVLSWRKELAEARSAHLLTARAPQTARALKPLSVQAASEREVRRPSRCAARPAARAPAVARPATSDAEAAAYLQDLIILSFLSHMLNPYQREPGNLERKN